jgi:hypothetical protein
MASCVRVRVTGQRRLPPCLPSKKLVAEFYFVVSIMPMHANKVAGKLVQRGLLARLLVAASDGSYSSRPLSVSWTTPRSQKQKRIVCSQFCSELDDIFLLFVCKCQLNMMYLLRKLCSSWLEMLFMCSICTASAIVHGSTHAVLMVVTTSVFINDEKNGGSVFGPFFVSLISVRNLNATASLGMLSSPHARFQNLHQHAHAHAHAHASFISTTTKQLPDSATNTDYVTLTLTASTTTPICNLLQPGTDV